MALTSKAELFPRHNARRVDTASLLRRMVVGPGTQPVTRNRYGSGWFTPNEVIGVRIRLSPRLSKAMNWMEQQFPRQIKRITKETHESLAFKIIEDALVHYRSAQRANRRPGASGRLEEWLNDPRKYDHLIKATPHAMSVNFRVLDLFVKNPRDNFPYWRAANYGYRPITIESGMFVHSGGWFTPPSAKRNKMDPRVINFKRSTRGSSFTIKFGGYGFVEAAEEKFLATMNSQYRDEFLIQLREVQGSPWDLEKIVRFYIGGGVIGRGGQMRSGATNVRIPGTMRDFLP